MKIKKIIILILILSFTTIGSISASIINHQFKATNSPVILDFQANSSDDFVESLGISTKFGFCPGHLCDNYPEVKALLAELGIRYIRDIPYPESWRKRTDLYEDHGIRMLAEAVRTWGKPLNLENISAQLDVIRSWGKMIVGIVGVTEYDNPAFSSCEKTPGCDPNWSETNWSKAYRQFQQRLYEEVNAERELRQLPVVLGPVQHLDNLEKVGDLSAFCDKGNDHSYPGAWGKPSQESGWGEKNNTRSMDEIVSKVQQVCSGKKLWITETGYDEKSDGDRNEYLDLISRQAKAKYLPRIYTNYYLQGQIEKTFIFELLDAIQTRTGHGIIDVNLEPTPAYYGIKNMISLLGEATWNNKTQSWKYPAFKPSSLKYTLEGDNTDIKHLLLQKSNGTFYLLIWQEVYVYDNLREKDLINPERKIEFKLDEATIEQAKKYLLYNESNPSAKLTPLQTWKNVSSLSLSIPDHILVLEFAVKK
ncbi:MAG: hypothetical protein ACRC2S_21565 [Waterburya sp.]